MTSGTLVSAIIFTILGLHSTTINVIRTVGNASNSCVMPTEKRGVCNLTWNVSNATLSKRYDKLKEINSTLAVIKTAYLNNECYAAILHVLCVKAFPKCNETNATSPSPEKCKIVTDYCTTFISKTHVSTACPSIMPYNNTECVDVNVSSTGYCPHTEIYKIPAENVSRFLQKAYEEKEMSPAGGACVDKYKAINCRSFVLSNCSNSQNISYENCEKELQCLASNSTLNRTELCLKFPREKQSVVTTTPTTDKSKLRYINITITVRLGKIKYNPDYEKKRSTAYKELSANITNALTDVYKSIAGFVKVEILNLTCNKEVAVKHNVIIRSMGVVNATVVTAKLDDANKTGFLKEKITQTDKQCEPAVDNGRGNNWVYMIVFVCVTALLLLAMVLCNQS